MAKARPDDRDDGEERERARETKNDRHNRVVSDGSTTVTEPNGAKRRRRAKIAVFLILTILAVLLQFGTFAVISPEWRIKYIHGGEDKNANAAAVFPFGRLENATRTTSTTTAVGEGDKGPSYGEERDEVVAVGDGAVVPHPLDLELTYQTWELDSIMSLNVSTVDARSGPKDKDIIGGRCVPPPSSSNKMCCLGSSSAGGATSFKRNAFCAVGGDAYEKVRVAAMRELNRGGSLQLLPQPSSSYPAGGEEGGRPPTSTPRATTTCDVCRMMDLSLRNNWTIGFTGDSVHHQVWDGFLCELSRNGYAYTSKVVKPDQGDNNRWRYGVKSIETVSIDVPVTPAWEDGGFASGETVSNGTTSRALATAISTVTARYYAQYRPLEDMSELAKIASETDVLVFNFGVHWLRNVEDNYEKTMRDVLSSLLRSGNTTTGNGKGGFAVLAMRETSAQHFDNPGGEFSREKRNGCVEMDDDDEVFGWRERIANRVADELGYRVIRSDAETLSSRLAELSGSASGEREGVETAVRAGEVPPAGGSLSANATVPKNGLLRRLLRRGRRRLVGEEESNSTTRSGAKDGTTTPPQPREDPIDTRDDRRDELLVLPFLNFTRGLRDLHKIGINGDCTHFCSSPFLWSPLWRSLRLGMDYREERLRLRRIATP